MEKIDGRTKEGRHLQAVASVRDITADEVKKLMPKLYYVEDFSMDRYRVGRTDWPGDVFECIPRKEFDAFRKIYEKLNMPLLDLTYDDGSEWDKVRT